ncbi:MAG: transketolase [Bryobacteraceae bacterium]|jgi:transketolase
MGSIATRPRLDCEAVVREKRRDKKSAMVQYLAQEFRVKVLDVLHDRGTGHWGGAASAAELLVALYFDAMNIRPDDPKWPDRDRLVVSKGHASCMLYTVLANRGYFPTEELTTFRQLDSRLQGHPSMRSTPGVEMSTGSLGHGTSVALGMALAARLLGKSYWTYVLVGDGDLNEGQTWEAIMAAAKFKPPRLVALIDYNKVQLDGPSDIIMPMDPLPEKLRAFNWNVAPVVYDGHNAAQVLESLEWAKRQTQFPVAVIYKTHKGRGVSFMEDNAHWHGAVIDDQSYAKARPELLETLGKLEAML